MCNHCMQTAFLGMCDKLPRKVGHIRRIAGSLCSESAVIRLETSDASCDITTSPHHQEVHITTSFVISVISRVMVISPCRSLYICHDTSMELTTKCQTAHIPMRHVARISLLVESSSHTLLVSPNKSAASATSVWPDCTTCHATKRTAPPKRPQSETGANLAHALGHRSQRGRCNPSSGGWFSHTLGTCCLLARYRAQGYKSTRGAPTTTRHAYRGENK